MPLFLLLILLCALPAVAGAVDIRERGESGVKFSTGEEGIFAARTQNLLFTFLPGKDLLIQEQVEVVYQTGNAEESFSQINVDAWKIDRNTLTKQHVWYISDTGERSEFSDDFYITHTQGCCTATHGSVYYSLENGNRLATSTVPLASIISQAPPSRRFLALHVAGSSLDDEVMGDRPNAVAAVTYFSPTRTLATLLLTAPATSDGERTAWLATLAEDAMITIEKGQNTRVKLTFPGSLIAHIPLKDDRFDLEHAILPKGWLAEEVPLMLQNIHKQHGEEEQATLSAFSSTHPTGQ